MNKKNKQKYVYKKYNIFLFITIFCISLFSLSFGTNLIKETNNSSLTLSTKFEESTSESFSISELKSRNLIYFLGRTFYSEEDECQWFNFSLSGFMVKFVGTELDGSFLIKTLGSPQYDAYISVVVDLNTSHEKSFSINLSNYANNESTINVPIVSNLDNMTHSLYIYKRSEAYYTSIGIANLSTDNYFLIANSKPTYKFEFYGDDIICGAYVEETSSSSTFSTATENPLKTYPYLFASNLSSTGVLTEISEIAFGGAPIFKSASLSSGHSITNIPMLIDKSNYGYETWDNSSFEPDGVIIDLGINDKSFLDSLDSNSEDYITYKEDFTNCYINFIDNIFYFYPNTKVFVASNMISLGDTLEALIDNVVLSFDANVYRINFTSQSLASIMPNNHPNAKQQYYASNELGQKLAEIYGFTYPYNNPSINTVFLRYVLPFIFILLICVCLPLLYYFNEQIKKIIILKRKGDKK